jgi:hypothetical protein
MSKQIPGPGRIVHARFPSYNENDMHRAECRAAIVTGLDISGRVMFVTIFAPNLAPQQAILNWDAPGWHWPTDPNCPFFISSEQALHE